MNSTPAKYNNNNLNQAREDESPLQKATGGLFVFEYREAGGGGGGGCLFQIINRLEDNYKNKTEVGLTFWGRNGRRAVKRQDAFKLGIFQNYPSNDSVNKFQAL